MAVILKIIKIFQIHNLVLNWLDSDHKYQTSAWSRPEFFSQVINHWKWEVVWHHFILSLHFYYRVKGDALGYDNFLNSPLFLILYIEHRVLYSIHYLLCSVLTYPWIQAMAELCFSAFSFFLFFFPFFIFATSNRNLHFFEELFLCL